MCSRRCLLLLLAVGLLWPLAAMAITNVEEVQIGAPPEGFSGQINADIAGAAGNSDKLTLATAGRAQWHGGNQTLFVVGDYAYGTSRGRQDTNRAFGHLRYRWQWRPRWASEAFVQASRDSFARLGFRGLIGGGLRRTLTEREKEVAAYLGLGAFYEREQLKALATRREPLVSSLWRGNAYLNLRRRINAQLRLASTTFYQPALAHPSDFRLLQEAALYIRALANIDVRIGLTVHHDSRPPTAVKATDMLYSSGIELRF